MSLDNSALDLEGDPDYLEFDLDPPRSEANPPTSESDLVTVGVIFELEAKEMASDLTTDFKRRMCKQLHEPIDMVTPSAKKPRPEEVRDQPTEEVAPTLVPHPDTARSNSVPLTASPVREEARLAQDHAQADQAPIPEEKDQKDKPPCVDPLTWEEMKKILERTPCFTDPESPPTKMPDFFSPIVRLRRTW